MKDRFDSKTRIKLHIFGFIHITYYDETNGGTLWLEKSVKSTYLNVLFIFTSYSCYVPYLMGIYYSK